MITVALCGKQQCYKDFYFVKEMNQFHFIDLVSQNVEENDSLTFLE